MGVFQIWTKKIKPLKRRKTEYTTVVVPPPLSTTLTPQDAVVPPPLSTTVTPQDAVVSPPSHSTATLTLEDARKILERFTKEQLLEVLRTDTVRSITDSNPTHRQLFIHGIGRETTTDTLRSVFSAYGELEDVKLITNRNTRISKGYGFVTFKHIGGVILALTEPKKEINGRTTVVELATPRESVLKRKIYVGNVPFEMSSERLLGYFSHYGEIEKGPLGFNKQLGEQKGFAFFVYKTEEGARNSVAESVKNIDGHRVVCKMANVGKKGKAGGLPSYGGQNSQILPRKLDGISERLGSGLRYFGWLLVAAAAMAYRWQYVWQYVCLYSAVSYR